MTSDQRVTAISYAIRPQVVAKYIGQTGLMLALLSLAPLAVSLLFAEYDFTIRYLVVITLLVLSGMPTARLPTPAHIQTNEGLTIGALAFVLTPLVMTYPMMAGGVPFEDAYFESVSGITTTGLSTLASVEDKSVTFLFSRAWMQWYGGLGIVVLSVALLMGHQSASRRLIDPEVAGADLLSTTRKHAQRVLAIYLILSLVGLVAVWLCVPDGFTALILMFSAVSTGGFAPFDDSLMGVNLETAAFVIMLIGFASAITIPSYYRAYQSGWRSLLGDMEFRALLVLTTLVGVAMAASIRINMGMTWQSAGFHGLLLGMSAQSTTGFATLAVDQLDPVSKLVMIPSMFLGGSLGSTAGGIKLLRLLILLRILQLWLRRTGAPPHAVIEPRLAGMRLENTDMLRALIVIALYGSVVLASWMTFVILGYDPLDSLFEVVSATGTVGLSTGITGPDLKPFLKGLLCLNMLAGRVEVFAILVLLLPATWFGKRSRSL